MLVRKIDHFADFLRCHEFGAFMAREVSDIQAGSGQVSVGMQDGVGLGMNHVAVFLVLDSDAPIFTPGETGFVDARNEAIVAHADLVMVLVDKHRPHFCRGIFGPVGSKNGLAHEVLIPIDRGLHLNEVNG